MANESVANEQIPSIFSGNDASVYISQAIAVADLLGTVNPEQCAANTVTEAGMLIFMLLTAANESDARASAKQVTA